MQPVSPVIPGLEQHEKVFAKDQPQYLPLPALRTSEGRVVARWSPTPEEREMIAQGADLFLGLLTFNMPLQPHFVYVAHANPDGAKALAQCLGLGEFVIPEKAAVVEKASAGLAELAEEKEFGGALSSRPPGPPDPPRPEKDKPVG